MPANTIFLHRILNLASHEKQVTFKGEIFISNYTFEDSVNKNIKYKTKFLTYCDLNEQNKLINYISNRIDFYPNSLALTKISPAINNLLNGYFYYNESLKRIEVLRNINNSLQIVPLNLTGNFSVQFPGIFDEVIVRNKIVSEIYNSQQNLGFLLGKKDDGTWLFDIDEIRVNKIYVKSALFVSHIFEFLNFEYNLEPNEQGTVTLNNDLVLNGNFKSLIYDFSVQSLSGFGLIRYSGDNYYFKLKDIIVDNIYVRNKIIYKYDENNQTINDLKNLQKGKYFTEVVYPIIYEAKDYIITTNSNVQILLYEKYYYLPTEDNELKDIIFKIYFKYHYIDYPYKLKILFNINNNNVYEFDEIICSNTNVLSLDLLINNNLLSGNIKIYANITALNNNNNISCALNILDNYFLIKKYL